MRKSLTHLKYLILLHWLQLLSIVMKLLRASAQAALITEKAVMSQIKMLCIAHTAFIRGLYN